MSEPAITAIKRFHPLRGAEFSDKIGPDLLMVASADCAKFSLHMDLEHLGKAAAAFGSDILDQPGGVSTNGEKTALWLGPDEWLLLTPEVGSREIVSRFSTLGDTVPHSLVDVSDRTVAIDLSGPLATRALNAGCPLDLENMPVSYGTRTVLEQTEIIIIKLDNKKYRLEIIRSFTPYIWSFLEKAGRDFHQSGYGKD